MSSFYDRKGKPIDVTTWSKGFENNGRDKLVRRDDLANGIVISTVWLGIDHNFGVGPPLIFESMIFSDKRDTPKAELDCIRYSTEKQAIAGHKRLVEKWRDLSDE